MGQEERATQRRVSFWSLTSLTLFLVRGTHCVENIPKSHLQWIVLEKYRAMNSCHALFSVNKLNNFRGVLTLSVFIQMLLVPGIRT